MVFCYGNEWTASNTVSTTGLLWMGSGGGGTATITSTTASDCYMWAGTAVTDQMQAAAQMQQTTQWQFGQSQTYQMQAAAQQQIQANLENQRMLHAAQQRHEVEERRTQPARDRAKELLLANLTPAQKETFEKNGWFLVEGGKSKQRYRIRANSASMNIDVMNKEKVTHRICAHLHHTCDAPLYDHILAQKLMLEAAEDDFLKIANQHAA